MTYHETMNAEEAIQQVVIKSKKKGKFPSTSSNTPAPSKMPAVRGGSAAVRILGVIAQEPLV